MLSGEYHNWNISYCLISFTLFYMQAWNIKDWFCRLDIMQADTTPYSQSDYKRRSLRSDTTFGIWKPFKKMKNTFYFSFISLFVLKIFKFLSWLFGHVGKRTDVKDQVNFKIYDVTTWLTNKCNTYIYQYRRK